MCGGVRYEITTPFRRANFCHCARCRKHSGAAALAQGRVPVSGFALLQGRDLLVNDDEPGHMAKVFCACLDIRAGRLATTHKDQAHLWAVAQAATSSPVPRKSGGPAAARPGADDVTPSSCEQK